MFHRFLSRSPCRLSVCQFRRITMIFAASPRSSMSFGNLAIFDLPYMLATFFSAKSNTHARQEVLLPACMGPYPPATTVSQSPALKRTYRPPRIRPGRHCIYPASHCTGKGSVTPTPCRHPERQPFSQFPVCRQLQGLFLRLIPRQSPWQSHLLTRKQHRQEPCQAH